MKRIPFDIKYPYVNDEIMNLDWILAKINELSDKVDDITADILDQAKAYTDEQLANYQQQVQDIRSEFGTLVATLQTNFNELKQSVNDSLVQVDLKLAAIEDLIAAEVAAVNERTDLKIEQNNAYLLDRMQEYLSQIEVFNILTGEHETLQAMLNYLASLHLENPITYNELLSRNITYNALAALSITYTDLTINGAILIPE